MQVQLILISASMILPSTSFPKIFLVSNLTFPSSFGIYGKMLSVIPIAETPDFPPPEIACIEVIITFFAPYCSSNGFSVIANPVVVQFGSGATNPFQLRFFF